MDRSMLNECLTNCIPSVPMGRSIYLEQLHNSIITMHVTFIITVGSVTLFIMLHACLEISKVTNRIIFHAQKLSTSVIQAMCTKQYFPQTCRLGKAALACMNDILMLGIVSLGYCNL